MKAYITLLSNQRYFLGVVGLHRALQAVKAKYPLYCLLSKGADPKMRPALESIGVKCVALTDETVADAGNIKQNGYAHWSYTFDKLRIWGLTQFEKLVFLDSDMLIRENIDCLFDMPPFSAAVAGGKMFGWTKLNSGLMVVVPDKETERKMLELAPAVIGEYEKMNVSVGDQDVIQRYCSDWEDKPELHLSEAYNIVADWIITYVRKFGFSWSDGDNKVKVVHFIGHTKPWTPKTLRERIWVAKTCLRNPFYFLAYRKFHSLINEDKKRFAR